MAQVFLIAQNFDIYDGDGLDLFARTGSTSVEHVAKAGAMGVVLGHGEASDELPVVKMKLATVFARELPEFERITLMVGESWEENEGRTDAEVGKIIGEQASYLLEDIPEKYLQNLVIAYDPKWGSRGSGNEEVPPPSPELISAVAQEIRAVVPNVPVIYGGRSTPDRTVQILADPNVDGLILGSACNTVQKTADIINAMKQAKPEARKVLHANFKAFNITDSYEDYVKVFRELDDSFVIYMSPCHSDLRSAAEALAHE